MRLTLRTLLAYVDDTLPPDQAREIGQKVAESHVAQELMERIKKVTRRRGLTVPPAAGPDRIDANTVGEYLDNDLPADRVAEVEEMALNSDVHLAEIAACHQILTLVLGEPAHVPPTARERMYGLVQGKESEPHRRASRIGPPAFPGETETADDLRAARRGLGLRLLGACIIGIALAVAIWQALLSLHPAPKAADGEASADSGAQPDRTPPPKPKPDIKTIEPEPKPPVAPPTPPPTPDKITPPVAPKPPVVKPPDRSPSTQRKAAGQFASKDAVLLSQVGKDWAKIAPDAKIDTTVPIMALPGSHAELKLDTGARLTLWGGLPETTGWKVLDCQVTLHVPPAGYDLDCTVDHGRVYLATAKMSGPTKARVRFGGQIWDLTLEDEQTEAIIEVSRLFAGEPFKKDVKDISPRTDVTLAVLDGEAQVTADSKTYDLSAPPGPAELHWDSKVKGPLTPVKLVTAPAAWAKTPAKFPRERQLEIDAAQQKLVQRLGEKGKSVEIALAEVAQDTNRASKVLGVLGQGAIGSLPQLLDALEEPQFPEARAAAAAALAEFIAREPGADQQVFSQLQSRRGYTARQAEQALWLLHGFNDAQLSNPATYEQLIDALHGETAVRELAAWRLRQIDPEGAALARFNSTDPEAAREMAVGEWQRRIPPGKLPPPRPNPQGRALPPAPNRG